MEIFSPGLDPEYVCSYGGCFHQCEGSDSSPGAAAWHIAANTELVQGKLRHLLRKIDRVAPLRPRNHRYWDRVLWDSLLTAPHSLGGSKGIQEEI